MNFILSRKPLTCLLMHEIFSTLKGKIDVSMRPCNILINANSILEEEPIRMHVLSIVIVKYDKF